MINIYLLQSITNFRKKQLAQAFLKLFSILEQVHVPLLSAAEAESRHLAQQTAEHALQSHRHRLSLLMRAEAAAAPRGQPAQEQLFCLLPLLLLVAAAKALKMPSICCHLQVTGSNQNQTSTDTYGKYSPLQD